METPTKSNVRFNQVSATSSNVSRVCKSVLCKSPRNMDLTYMPGELDNNQEKKGNASEMKRDHDSVDDFEHLDPESSPIDGQHKAFTPAVKMEITTESLLEKEDGVQNLTERLVENVANGDSSHPSPKHFQSDDTSSSDHLPTKDLLSDFSSNLQTDVENLVEEKSILPNSEKNVSSVPTPLDKQIESECVNSNFIAAETIYNSGKTDSKADNIESKPKDNTFKELLIDHDSDKKAEDEKDLLKNFDIPKSMKADDALSQYEIKPERKDHQKTDTLLDEITPQHDIASATEKTEPISPKVETESPKTEIHEEIPVTSKQESTQIIDDVKEDLKEKSIGDTKPFIAICPPKPELSKGAEKKTSISDLNDIIGPEDVFKRIGLVEALVYWRDPKKSGIVFGSIMAVLLSLCYMSLISVVAYFSLFALTGTICFRIYKNILQAVQKNDEGHPFKEFLDLELSLPQDKVREVVDTTVVHVNAGIVELRRLFLVEDLIDSIKFGVCLWCFTYVGAIFNGMTLVILSFVALFTVPKIYENNKASIDQYIEMGRSKVADITSKVKAAVPIGKKEPAEKDKEQ